VRAARTAPSTLARTHATPPPSLPLPSLSSAARASRLAPRLGSPAGPIAIGGQRVLGLLPLFPNLIPQVLCVSYDGRMWMSLVLDAEATPEPHRIGSLYLEELRALAAHARVPFEDGAPPPPRAGSELV
jgi:hypothetical protein